MYFAFSGNLKGCVVGTVRCGGVKSIDMDIFLVLAKLFSLTSAVACESIVFQTQFSSDIAHTLGVPSMRVLRQNESCQCT